ncbi:MAG: hypothetical protein B7Z13_01080 [Caulobacterales bacterium 32-67-6]|nr:MAG: hypothetical protein B7Z13_01080 [Caulobacterales bacterium 32-67-6]
MADPIRALATLNGRFAPQFAQTMLGKPRSSQDGAAFAAHCQAMGFEFTTEWADNNIPYVAPLLRDFAATRGQVRYLEIGAYEGRNLAFMDWLLPAKLDVTVIDPWFDETLNPEEKYHAVEPRFHYWHDESEIGGPGVKQAVDRFHGIFRHYFEISAVYRQVALTKIAEIPR